MAYNVTIIALLGSNDILIFFSQDCLQDSGQKMGKIAKSIDNGKKLTLPVKALYTGKPSKPVLPDFTGTNYQPYTQASKGNSQKFLYKTSYPSNGPSKYFLLPFPQFCPIMTTFSCWMSLEE